MAEKEHYINKTTYNCFNNNKAIIRDWRMVIIL